MTEQATTASETLPLTEAQRNTAMKTPEHLKRWLVETGRRFLVFNSIDLVDSLPWPAGVEALLQIVDSYRDHRRVQTTGRFTQMKHPDQPASAINIPIHKTEFLELSEVDAAIRSLIGIATAMDPSWSLENQPL